jgi:hypothetical protein
MMQIAPVLTSLIAGIAIAQLRQPEPVSWRARPPAPQPPAAVRPATGDSARTVRDARRAQERFEALRRANLPFGPGGTRGPCDLQVGRLCYWHEDGESPPEIPEPGVIARGRERLLAVLADAARLAPGDEWLVGQRVRYLIDARRPADAVAVAAECQSTQWWCAVLTGLALHRSGDYARAESTFADALAAMPPEQRCKWTDLSLFLEGDAGKRYRRLTCAERAALERRFWWLSQPLYGRAGNDVRTEFFARRTVSRLEQQARSAYNMSWGSDVDELLMRYGWPTWWTRDHPSTMSATSAPPSIVGHEPTPSFFFHPSPRLLDAHAADAIEDDWEPRMKRPPARYAPSYAATFADLRTQVALFRREDSAVVVATFDHPRDTLFNEGATEAVLAIGRDETTPITVVRRTSNGRDRVPLIAKTVWGPMLVSVELTAARKRGVARARFGVRPDAGRGGVAAGRLALSDLLLYGSAGRPTSLEDAARDGLAAPRLATGGRVGVYWEIYGVRPAGEPLSVTLSVERVGVGWQRRAAERLRLATKVTPLRVRWQEVPKRDAGFASRAIDIDLSALPAGRYRMQLTVVADDGSTTVSERLIELFSGR